MLCVEIIIAPLLTFLRGRDRLLAKITRLQHINQKVIERQY